jgi:hypothetical protein
VNLKSQSFSQHRCWVMAKYYELYRCMRQTGPCTECKPERRWKAFSLPFPTLPIPYDLACNPAGRLDARGPLMSQNDPKRTSSAGRRGVATLAGEAR